MHRHLIQKRTVWLPTRLGWLILCGALAVPLALWAFLGERFLAHTERLPAEALVVEGWIGVEGVRAAKLEFDRHGYRYIVTAGGSTNFRWGPQHWNYATESREMLLLLHLPPDKVLAAPVPETEKQRTFTAALGVKRALELHGLHPASVNVFTLGVHARRSRLVFAKALPGTEVGVVSWRPSEYKPEPWWRSSERAVDLLKESIGYLFELLLSSGRWSNSTPDLTTKDTK
jgi:uncharacterized SAM-binding protein YcdF (DUF218 family)